ncbi:hypothetical protein AB0J01_27850 [Streptomyces sp. NPDC050204]|uniref:hypothetical protein n=1 Tax=Streptomyces sp. NPDC050204 TaxID=3155514 RepID=UPI003441A95A
MLTWRPDRPAEYIRSRLIQQANAEHRARQASLAGSWDDTDTGRAFRASRPDLVRNVLGGLAVGLAAYSAHQAERGLDDLTNTTSRGTWTDADAAADVAAFLGALA